MYTRTSEPRLSETQVSGFQRYIFGREFILESNSWADAQAKIRDFLARHREVSSELAFYYDDVCTILWREYQFLFLCQLLEFRLAEFLSHLTTQGKIADSFLKQLQKYSKADSKRATKVARLMSPASLLVDFGYTLGNLINVLAKETLEFENKVELVEKLGDFNRNRISFIHH